MDEAYSSSLDKKGSFLHTLLHKAYIDRITGEVHVSRKLYECAPGGTIGDGLRSLDTSGSAVRIALSSTLLP